MKTIKQCLLVILLIALASNVLSQESEKVRGDSIRIRFDDCLLEVSTYDLKINTLEKAEIQKKINELLKAIENVEINTPEDGKKICISYSALIEGEEQDFKKLHLSSVQNENKTIIVKDGELLETDFGNVILQIEDKDYLIRLYLNSLDDAQKVNSKEFIEKLKVADNVVPKGRKKINVWLKENNSESFNSYFLDETPPYCTLDQLELNAGIITGLIKNKFVTGFDFQIGLTFAKKGIMKSKYFAVYELVYDFSNPPEGKSFVSNDFLSVGYDRNFSLNPNKANWYGFSLGYLVNRNNDFFEKNTFKISIHKQFNRNVSLKPEVYFNDFFKNVYPGLRVQISF